MLHPPFMDNLMREPLPQVNEHCQFLVDPRIFHKQGKQGDKEQCGYNNLTTVHFTDYQYRPLRCQSMRIRFCELAVRLERRDGIPFLRMRV